MRWTPLGLSILCLIPILVAVASTKDQPTSDQGQTKVESKAAPSTLKVQYLEIVTPAVAETCEALAKAHGVVFSEPVAAFGNARTADLKGGGRLGVRAPMRTTEEPVVRPYVLVDDIVSALKVAVEAGAKVALPPMPIPGQGTFAIYILGGIEHGLWQL